MAYNKTKKTKIWTKQDQEWVDKMLSASKNWDKLYKGEIVFKRAGCQQEFVIRAKYNAKSELEKDAEDTIACMNSIDKGRTWTLVSATLVGQSIDDSDVTTMLN